MKIIKQLPLVLAVSALTATPALATTTNFPHTNFGVTVGSTSFDEKIYLLSEEGAFFDTYDVYSGAAAYGLELNYQAKNNLIVGFSFSGLYSGSNETSISGSTNSLYAGYVLPVGEHIDIVPTIGTLSTSAKVCNYKVCAETSDSGIAYGLRAQAWLVRDVFEVNISYADATLDYVDATTGFGIAYWGDKNRRVSLNITPASDSTSTTLTWAYYW